MQSKMCSIFYCFIILLNAICVGQITIAPEDAECSVGGEIIIQCKVDFPIDNCNIMIGGVSYRLRPNVENGEIVYFGKGLVDGECGVHIKRVKEEMYGDITCYLPQPLSSIEVTASMRLTKPKNILIYYITGFVLGLLALVAIAFGFSYYRRNKKNDEDTYIYATSPIIYAQLDLAKTKPITEASQDSNYATIIGELRVNHQ